MRKSQRQHSNSLIGVVQGAMGPLTITKTCVCLEVTVLGVSFTGFGSVKETVLKKQAQAGLTLLISSILYLKFLFRGREGAMRKVKRHQNSLS